MEFLPVKPVNLLINSLYSRSFLKYDGRVAIEKGGNILFVWITESCFPVYSPLRELALASTSASADLTGFSRRASILTHLRTIAQVDQGCVDVYPLG